MANGLYFLLDPEYWRSVRETAPNSLAGLAKGLTAGTVGAPVDIANMALQPLGLGSERPVGGSNYLGRLMGAETESTPYQVGSMLPVSPADLAQGVPVMVGMAARKGGNLVDLWRPIDMMQDVSRSVPNKTDFEIAQRNAALPVDQGRIMPMSDNYDSYNLAKEAGYDLPEGHRLWFRFGDLPENGISKHVQHGYEEGGTSVLFPVPVLGKSSNYWGDQLLMSMTAGEMGTRPLKIISGKQKKHDPFDVNQRGYGSDGEPLLEPDSVKSIRDATPLERHLLVKDMEEYAISKGFSALDGTDGKPNIFKLLNAENPTDALQDTIRRNIANK